MPRYRQQRARVISRSVTAQNQSPKQRPMRLRIDGALAVKQAPLWGGSVTDRRLPKCGRIWFRETESSPGRDTTVRCTPLGPVSSRGGTLPSGSPAPSHGALYTSETASCSDVTGNYCNQSTITFKSLGKGDWRCPASRRKIPGKLCFFVTQQQPTSIATIKFTGSLLRLPEQESGAVNHLAHRNIVGVGRPANDFLRQEPAAPISARPGKGQPVRVVPAGINSYLRSGWIRNESALTQWPDYECEGSIDSCLSFPSTLSRGL
jgi:hypothetical protein